MKREAGPEVELPAIVFLDPLAPDPVFHRAGEQRWGVTQTERLSSCRRVVVSSARGDAYRSVFPIRSENAVKIGRACLYCWPQLRAPVGS